MKNYLAQIVKQLDRRVVLWAPAIPVSIISVVILIGWATNNRALISLSLPPPFMPGNIAICFLFSCLSLICSCLSFRRAAIGAAAVVLVLSGLTLIEHLFSSDIGIDQLFFSYQQPEHMIFPGRAELEAASSFFLMGLILILTALPYKHINSIIAEILCGIISVIAVSDLFEYLAKLSPIIDWSEFTAVSLDTAVGLIVLVLSIFVYHSLSAEHEAKFFLAPVIGFVFFIITTITILRESFHMQQLIALHNIAQINTPYLARTIELALSHRAVTFERLAQRIDVLGSYSKGLWDVDVGNSINDFASLYAVTLYNKDYQIENQHVKSGVENPLRHQAVVLETLKNLSKEDFEKPFIYKLINSDLVFLIPLHTQGKIFNGLLVCELSISIFLETNLPGFFFEHFDIRISNQGDMFYERMIPNAKIIGLPAHATILPSFLQWDIFVFSTEKTLPLIENFLLLFSLVAFGDTIAMIVMVFLVIGVYITRNSKAKLAVVLKEKGEAVAFRQAILDGSNYSIISTDKNGIIVSFNPAAEKMLQWTGDELIGKFSPAIFHDPKEIGNRALELSTILGKPISSNFEVFTTLVLQDIPDEHEWTYIRKDGTRFPVQLSISVIKDPAGSIIGFLGIAYDLTKTHELEELKASLMSITSHELRSPITSIKGSLDLLADQGNLSSENLSLIEISRKNCERLIRLTTAILDTQKIESGKMDFNFKTISIKTILKQAYEFNQSLALKSQVILENPENTPDIMVSGDEDRLIQVLTNFISNAIKHSNPNSTVSFPVFTHDNWVHVAVKDQGPGIPDEFKAHIFEKFKQAPTSQTNAKGGTGLGLYISKAIIEAHKGKIGVDSTLEGTLFWFELPIVST